MVLQYTMVPSWWLFPQEESPKDSRWGDSPKGEDGDWHKPAGRFGHQISSFNQQFAHVISSSNLIKINNFVWWCFLLFVFEVSIFYCKDWAEFAKNLGGWMRVLYIWNILENKIKEAILLWDKWYYTYVCNGLKHNFLASNRATPHQRNIRACNAIFKYTLMQCSIQLTSCPFVHSSGCIPQIYGIAGECNTLASLNHPNIIGCLGLFWFQHKNNI